MRHDKSSQVCEIYIGYAIHKLRETIQIQSKIRKSEEDETLAGTMKYFAYLPLAAAAAPAEPGDKIVNEIIDDDDGRRR